MVRSTTDAADEEHTYELVEECPYWRCGGDQTFGWFGSDEDGEYRCLSCDHTLDWARNNRDRGDSFESVKRRQKSNAQRVGSRHNER